MVYNEGDKSVAICENCQDLVPTEMAIMNYEFVLPNKVVIVEDVLLAVCEMCDMVVGIPHQSIGKFNEARNAK